MCIRDSLEVDNTAVRLEQIENLKRLKEGRNQAEVDKALAAITEGVKTGKGNLLELAVEAAHEMCIRDRLLFLPP